jgi:hypothetical protein
MGVGSDGVNPKGPEPDSTKVLTDLAIRSGTMVLLTRTARRGRVVRPHLGCTHGSLAQSGPSFPGSSQEPPIRNTTTPLQA